MASASLVSFACCNSKKDWCLNATYRYLIIFDAMQLKVSNSTFVFFDRALLPVITLAGMSHIASFFLTYFLLTL